MGKVKKLNEAIEIPSSLFTEKGIFNPFIGIDTHLFLDPALLRETSVPEFKDSYGKIVKYFSDTLRLLKLSKLPQDRASLAAWRRLIFREKKGISIGYSSNTDNGGGVGPKLALQIMDTAIEILNLGISDPALFELIPLFEDGFGADRLSDIAISIIHEDIVAYTSRIVKELKVDDKYLIKKSSSSTAIKHPNDGTRLFLLPQELLKDLPTVLETDDTYGCAAYFNEALRGKLSALIIGDAGRSLKDLTKEEYRTVIFNKNDFEAVLSGYKTIHSVPYDFKADPAGEMAWYEQGKEFARKNPLKIELKEPKTLNEVSAIVRKIIDHFKKSIENNNLYELLYKEPISALKPKNERAAQRLFYSIADAYCEANNIVLSREPNAGNGPVDFKVSEDYKTQVLVELKLSSGKVKTGYLKQLPVYEKNENAGSSFLVILKVTNSSASSDSVKKMSEIAIAEGKRVPRVIQIDALPREKASA